MLTPESETRRNDLDWLRLIAICILLFYHTGMLFNPWEWHIKNSDISEEFRYWMVWLHYWRMPLLLFISGAGTFLALRKRTPSQFVLERIKRLVIPLAFGMFVIVPPQIYFEHFEKYADYADFYRTVFNFEPYPEGSFSWHHLWFIAYLFLYSLISLPFLIFLKSSKAAGFQSGCKKLLSHPVGMLFIPSLLILFTQIILRPYFPDETHALIDDWGFFIFYLIFFLMGILGYSQTCVWDSVRINRKYFLTAGMLILIPFYGLYLHFRGVFILPFQIETVETLFDIVTIFGSWFWVIAVIAWGQHYLNKPHPWLHHFNEGLYPFYILHQTVIIVVGFYICQLPWGILEKFITVAFLTLITCLLLYFLLIRPFNLMRIFFGMRIKKIDN